MHKTKRILEIYKTENLYLKKKGEKNQFKY